MITLLLGKNCPKPLIPGEGWGSYLGITMSGHVVMQGNAPERFDFVAGFGIKLGELLIDLRNGAIGSDHSRFKFAKAFAIAVKKFSLGRWIQQHINDGQQGKECAEGNREWLILAENSCDNGGPADERYKSDGELHAPVKPGMQFVESDGVINVQQALFFGAGVIAHSGISIISLEALPVAVEWFAAGLHVLVFGVMAVVLHLSPYRGTWRSPFWLVLCLATSRLSQSETAIFIERLQT